MRFSPPSIQRFASSAAAANSNASMSSSRANVIRGLNPWHRGFCDRPSEGEGEFVSGDSHLKTVRDANEGYRRGYRVYSDAPRGSPRSTFRPRPAPEFRPPPPSGVHPPPDGYYPPPNSGFQHSPQGFHPPPNSGFEPPPHGFHPPPEGFYHGPNVYRHQPQGPHYLPLGYPPPTPGFHPTPRPKPADYRNWISAPSQLPPHCERFKVLSYNILADYLARDHRSRLYFHIPHRILDWEWRKRRILIELGLWSPDIMCLQEVDRFKDLEEELTIRGYQGIWKMRTGSAIDGCAIFWRVNRFQLRHEEHIEFNKLGLRDNVAQICVLESRAQESVKSESAGVLASPVQPRDTNKVVICNIHVLYNPRRGEIKLGQVRVLLDRAYSVSRVWNNAPVVICGDFNSTPKSPLYNFISEQKLNLSGLARDQVSGQYSKCIQSSEPYLGESFRRDGSPQTNLVNIMSSFEISTEKVSSQVNSDDCNDAKVEQEKMYTGVFDTEETPSPDFLAELHGPEAHQSLFDPSSSETDKRHIYDPSSWTPMEIQTASGNVECTFLQHNLKLKSAYAEVEDCAGTEDSNGEPHVTSYHRQFMGTVDYIWYSEGVQTVKVLDTIRKDVLEQTPGFPTHKWGSDHLALACELGFTNDLMGHE